MYFIVYFEMSTESLNKCIACLLWSTLTRWVLFHFKYRVLFTICTVPCVIMCCQNFVIFVHFLIVWREVSSNILMIYPQWYTHIGFPGESMRKSGVEDRGSRIFFKGQCFYHYHYYHWKPPVAASQPRTAR